MVELDRKGGGIRMSYKPGNDDDAPNQAPSYRYLPCRVCGKSTLVETLSNYGARCFSCFEAYCAAAGTSAAPVTREAVKRIGQGGEGGLRAWAYRLRERHQGGERLTRAQVDAYQAVLGDHESA